MNIIGAIAIDENGAFYLLPHVGADLGALNEQLAAGANAASAIEGAKRQAEAARRERNEAVSRLIDIPEKLAAAQSEVARQKVIIAQLNARIAELEAAAALAAKENG